MRRRAPGRPAVRHRGQPAGLIPLPALLDRARGHRPLPPRQRYQPRIVLRPGNSSRLGVRRQASQHLHDVPLPPQCLGDRGLRQPVKRAGRRQRNLGPPHRPVSATRTRVEGPSGRSPRSAAKSRRQSKWNSTGRTARGSRAPGQPSLTGGLPASRLAGPGRDLERLRVPGPDPLIGPDIDHQPGPVGQPGEEVRSMTPAPPARHASAARTAATQPPSPPGRSPAAPGALQPRLLADVTARRRQPPPAREMTLPPRPPERTGRNRILETLVHAPAQRDTTAAVRVPENQLNTKVIGPRRHCSSQLHQPRPKVRCPPGTTGQTLVRQKTAADKDR